MFIQAIADSFKHMGSVLGSEYFQLYRGVKQGAANSCALFTFYVNGTNQKLKEFGEDGFLGNLQSLLFICNLYSHFGNFEGGNGKETTYALSCSV